MKSPSSFLVSVAPIARIPLSRDQSFFYTFNTLLDPGTLVEIPFGRRMIQGIVTDCQTDFVRAGGIALKPVRDIITHHLLTQAQLELADFLSTHYYTPLGIVLPLFILPQQSSKTNPTTTLPSLTSFTLSATSQKICNQLLAADSSSVLQTTFSPASYHALAFLVQQQLQNAFAADGTPTQILIQTPERCHVPMLATFLRQYFPAEVIATYASTDTGGARSMTWERIRSGDAHIIIGSRSAIFAPFARLSLIITWSAHSMTYKQWEKHPRYDSRLCADQLAVVSSTKHIRISPALTTAPHNTQTLSLGTSQLPPTTLVDMKIEYNEVNEKRFKKSHPALSRTLITEIKKVLVAKQQALLFVGRSGKNAFSVCEKCRTVARCPQCERALTESTRGHHRCHHCPYVTDVFPACSNCRSLTFQSVGLGTERIEEEIKRLFPQARVARADKDSMKSRVAPAQLADRITSGAVDIIIGTQMIAGSIFIPQLAVCAVIDMDDMLESIDYDAGSRTAGRLLDMMHLCAISTVRSPQFIIQSYDTLHEIVQLFTTHKSSSALMMALHDWHEDDLMSHKILSLPPYSELIVIDLKSSKKHTLDSVSMTLYDRLMLHCGNDTSLVISEPYDPLVSKVRTMYKKKILIKIKKDTQDTYATIPESLHTILRDLPKEAIADRNPASIA